MPSKIFVVQGEGLGRGDVQLGKLLMSNFLRMMGDAEDKPAKLLFWNAGARLVCEGSEVLEYLKKLEAQGVEVLACTTCLEYFDLMDKIKVGKPTTMGKSIQAMLGAETVCL